MRDRKRLFGCCILGCLGWLLCRQIVIGKVFDESLAVRYEEYAASHTVEDATLFIGTYLIHVQGLTDELYAKALDSASDSNQMNVYYKSELASGAWLDITDAGGLSQITGQGTVVEESELADLWVTCYTGADGITRDARDDHVVNIFSEPSPYDLYSLEDLEPIRIQYSNMFSSDSTGVDAYYYKKLRNFFGLDLQNEVTQECDLQLLGLQGCYESLRASHEEELSEIVCKLMSRIDSKRRAEIFYRLSQMEGNELGILRDICAGSQFYKEDKKEDDEGDEGDGDGQEEEDDQEEDEDDDYDYDGEQFVENSGVMDAVGLSIQNCQQSYIEHAGNMLEEGDTVLKNAEYQKSMAVIERSAGGFGGEMESLLLELKHLYHLEENVVADAEAELRLLDGELISQADLKYGKKLSEGASGAYQSAVANHSSQAVKNQVLEDQKAETDAARLELQYLIQAKTKRLPAKEAEEFCYQRIEHAERLYGQVVRDDFQSKAQESIDAHILWLKDLARSVKDGNDDLASDLQKLEEKKTRLLEEQTGAMDRNDLSTVKKYGLLIDQVDREIEAAERQLSAVLAGGSGSAAERARAANQAGSGSVLNLISRTKDAALLMIAEGNTENQDGIVSKLDALAALGAESAIREIQEKMTASDNDYKRALTEAAQALEDSRKSSLYDLYKDAAGLATGGAGAGSGTGTGGAGAGTGSGTGAGSGTGTGGAAGAGSGTGTDGAGAGTGTGTGGAGTGESGTGAEGSGALTAGEEDLSAMIEEVMGAPFDDLDDQQKAAVAAALDRIAGSGNQAAARMAASCLNQCVREGNKYLYRKLKGESKEYLPLSLIAACTGYRYVYSDSKMEVTLSKKLSIYRFFVYQDDVALLGGATEKLEGYVKLQNEVPCLPEADAIRFFACEAEYMDDTEYGICLGPKASGWVKELVETLQEGAE